MAENSKIEWTTHTFNPWIGCQKVSPGCDHCYAEAMMDHRWGKVEWGPHGERKRTSEANWRKPLAWAKAARGASNRPRVFCASLADVFDNQAPTGARAELFNLIRATPELDWLLLTKRPENIRKMLPDAQSWGDGWPNVWLGTTCEDQEHMDRRVPILLKVPARIRFLSCEPMIGEISFRWASWQPWNRIGNTDHLDGLRRLDWIICGGESGGGAREMDAEWAAELRDECAEANVPFFMKQMTGKKPIPDRLMVRQFPSAVNPSVGGKNAEVEG